MGRLELAPAAPAEWPMACRLALGERRSDAMNTGAARLRELVQSGRFEPAGLLLAKQGGTPVGAIAAQLLPGDSGVLLPPFGLDEDIRTALVEAAREYFRSAGTVVAHCLLLAGETEQAAPLIAGGFRYITQIQHMLRRDSLLPEVGLTVAFEPYTETIEPVFAEILLRTSSTRSISRRRPSTGPRRSNWPGIAMASPTRRDGGSSAMRVGGPSVS